MDHFRQETRPSAVGRRQRGGCACGAVRYELEVEAIERSSPDDDVLVRARDFRLLAGEDTVSGHAFATWDVQRFYCEHCGVCSFTRRNVEQAGSSFYAVQLSCLDWV